MNTPTYTTELQLLENYRLIGGIDEVGRGPLAGPVVSAVVILNPDKIGKYRSKSKWWYGVKDSKLMSPRKRGSIAEFIRENAIDFGIGEVSHEEIDDLNIHHASLLSMKRALENLKILPDVILIDGKFTIPLPNPPHKGEGIKREFLPPGGARLRNGQGGKVGGIKQYAIVDGDANILSVAAASVLAKVHRDNLMRNYAKKYFQFGFERHKGYNTSFHRKRLLQYGTCEIHRFSFLTVREIISQRFQKMLF